MQDKPVRSQQQMRHLALTSQLIAIDAQATVLKTMDTEHSFGLESTFEVEVLIAAVHDFALSAEHLVLKAKSACIEEIRHSLQAVCNLSADLKTKADSLSKRGQMRAKYRLQNTVLEPNSQAENSEGTSDPGKLLAAAQHSCLQAELNQFATFSLQIHAICDLALEYCFNAASACARCNRNI